MYTLSIRSARRRRLFRLTISNLLMYGLAHAIVDAASAALVLSHFYNGRVSAAELATLIVLYNGLAFAGQPLIGVVSDKLRVSSGVAAIGCIITAAASLLYPRVIVSTILMAIGNAMFHVGGGIVSFNVYRGKASAPGIFVAPGAIGLVLGTLVGKSGSNAAATFAFLLLCFGAWILLIRQPRINYSYASEMRFEPYYLIILLLLTSIAARGIVGSIVSFSWKADVRLLILLTSAVALGKGFGGVLGDRFGWRKVATGGLLLAAPLIALGHNPLAGILGMLLLNVTMPITLTAVANLLPGFPGFAFGMTTLALVSGVFISYLPFASVLSHPAAVFFITFISAILLNWGLKLYFIDEEQIKIKTISVGGRSL